MPTTRQPLELDPRTPFVPLDDEAATAAAEAHQGEFAITIDLDDAVVDELQVDYDAPILTVRRTGVRPLELRYALLATVDAASIRASFDHGRLRVEARRRWGRPERIPIHSDFLWEGRVAHRPGELLPPRPASPQR